MNALLTRVSSVFTQNMTNLFTVRAAIVCIAVVIKLQFLGLSHCSLIIMNAVKENNGSTTVTCTSNNSMLFARFNECELTRANANFELLNNGMIIIHEESNRNGVYNFDTSIEGNFSCWDDDSSFEYYIKAPHSFPTTPMRTSIDPTGTEAPPSSSPTVIPILHTPSSNPAGTQVNNDNHGLTGLSAVVTGVVSVAVFIIILPVIFFLLVCCIKLKGKKGKCSLTGGENAPIASDQKRTETPELECDGPGRATTRAHYGSTVPSTSTGNLPTATSSHGSSSVRTKGPGSRNTHHTSTEDLRHRSRLL